jgi:hypothetical protein
MGGKFRIRMARTPSARADGRVALRLFWLFLTALQMQTMVASAQLYFHPFHHQMAVYIPLNHTGIPRIAAPKFLNLGALIKHLTPHARLANTSFRSDGSTPQR